MSKKYYITTPIFYATAAPHIGHMYNTIMCDVLARYHRTKGERVHFLTGTDEHGTKVYQKAREAGTTPQDFCNEQAAKYALMDDVLDISNDDFIRTTEDRHKKAAQEFWRKSYEKGDIYKKRYTGLYCVGCESFKTERDLVNGLCPDHQTKPELVEEENYFFKLSKYQKDIEKLFKERPDFVFPESKKNEMLSILAGGLDDVSISRQKEKLPWGIEVPNDPGQVMYVWFDALTNYVTAIGYGADNKRFNDWWPADVHVVGKEINRFHSLLWPAMLMSAGVELPQQIAVHGWITVDGQKMSKTIGNVVDPFSLTEKYPVAAVRYFMMREIPFDGDGDFSFKRFDERYSADLANGLGNLFNRVVTMIEKYCNGVVPELSVASHGSFKHTWEAYDAAFAEYRFDDALETVWTLLREADKTINEEEPWKLAGKNDIKLCNLLYMLGNICYNTAWLVYPFMPSVSEEMLQQLGLDPAAEWAKKAKDVFLPFGVKVKKGVQLFPRME